MQKIKTYLIRKSAFGLRIFPGFLTVLRVPGSSQGFSKYLKGTQGISKYLKETQGTSSETHTVLIIHASPQLNATTIYYLQMEKGPCC
jgi:hypothetical protein